MLIVVVCVGCDVRAVVVGVVVVAGGVGVVCVLFDVCGV